MCQDSLILTIFVLQEWGLDGLSAPWKRTPGLYVAVTPCRLHHLSHDIMEEIEERNLAMMLQLFKLLAHTLARRHDVAVEQLATLHSIVNASPPTKPVSRTTLGAINRALLSYQ